MPNPAPRRACRGRFGITPAALRLVDGVTGAIVYDDLQGYAGNNPNETHDVGSVLQSPPVMQAGRAYKLQFFSFLGAANCVNGGAQCTPLSEIDLPAVAGDVLFTTTTAGGSAGF